MFRAHVTPDHHQYTVQGLLVEEPFVGGDGTAPASADRTAPSTFCPGRVSDRPTCGADCQPYRAVGYGACDAAPTGRALNAQERTTCTQCRAGCCR